VKRFAEFLQRSVDARSYGVEFTAQKLGNFFVLQFLKSAEQKNFAFVFRQLQERAVEQFHLLPFLR
jgi:hypothetical protein